MKWNKKGYKHMNYRVFVKKKEMFQVEAQSLHHELKQNLNLSSLTGLELYNVYDIFHGDEHDFINIVSVCRRL